MMNQLFVAARQKYQTAQYDWPNLVLAVQLVDSLYVFNELHQFLSDIPVGSRAGTLETITNPIALGGFASGDSVSFNNLVHGEEINQVVIVVNTGDPTTTELIAYYDDVIGLPITATGATYTLAPDAAFGGFFRL